MEAHEALTLLEHLFSLSRTSLLIHMDEDCDEQKISSFEQMAARVYLRLPAAPSVSGTAFSLLWGRGC